MVPGAPGALTIGVGAMLGGVKLAPRFGLFIGQAKRSWPEIIDLFVMADELGFDHAWLVDHFVDTGGRPEDSILEGWTLLAALATHTRRIRLGILVSSNTFRHPSLLLKEAVTVDHISNGRLILGIGIGWHADEHRRYGFEFPDAVERVDRFEEAVQIADALMTQPRVTFHGRYYHLDDAVFEPRPIQQPRIPILIAAHRPRMLRIAARYADQWDTFPELPGTATEGVTTSTAERITRFKAEVKAAGRDPDTIRRSLWAPSQAIADDRTYIDFVRSHAALGFTDFAAALRHQGAEQIVGHMGRDLVPELRAELEASSPRADA